MRQNPNYKLQITNYPGSAGSVMVGLVFMVATFSIVVYALLLTVGSQLEFTFRQVALDQALNIAEAGVNYYRWHLAHAPSDFVTDTGVHDYRDPQGDLMGAFDLNITPPIDGSTIVTITSTGWAADFPEVLRTITAQYGQPSLASFSFLSDSSLWFGNGIVVGGPVHSNNGIRMDGTNQSTVTSSKETYTCGVETGCWPKTQIKPGVWGNGGPQALWSFPVPATDFDSISVDFAQMRTAAQTSGVYLGPSDAAGYHLVFNSGGTVAVYQVTATTYKRGYTLEDGCQNLYQTIVTEALLDTYELADISLLFAEDILWVEGVVNGQITVVAVRFPIGTFETNIWIPDNITYLAKDGQHKLGLMAQNDIYFALDVPDYFEIDAAMVAQNGRISRHHYNRQGCSHYNQSQRNEITIYGTVISREKSYWNFGSGPGQPASGFVKRTILYDQSLIYTPPPYFPTLGNYELISWREE
ncbi:MAG: hypothetical protein HYS86_00225 [Candidatus Chisholmbacteria bacterium]|nr:hypothetical protein [Candidatus Chisholmbacteria bacterium]